MRPAVLILMLVAAALPAAAQTPPPAGQGPAAAASSGAAVYERACAGCHATTASGAPAREVLRTLTPEAIHNALVNGKMQLQGSSLSEAERRAVSEFLAERPFGSAPVAAVANGRCTASPPMTDPARGPAWNGWGNGVTNARSAKDGGLTAADLP